jgi:hypothetical protein
MSAVAATAPAPAARGRRELEELDRIAVAQRVDQRRHHPARLFERLTTHGAARVEEHHEIAGQRSGRGRARGWRDREDAVAGTVAAASDVEREAGRVRRHRPADHHVAVERHAAVGERHAAVGGGDAVRGRLGRPDGVGDGEGELDARGERPGCRILHGIPDSWVMRPASGTRPSAPR